MKFELNQNYRNANEITEYINKELKMKMLKRGLDGIVKKVKFSKDIFIKPSNNDRVALIVKNLEVLYEFDIKTNDDKFNIVDTPISNMIRNKINIIPVNIAKGLEFEKVFVIDENMLNNEKYISYTRALNELFVIIKQ